MADEITDAIEQAAQEPKRVKGDMGEVEAHPIRELIEADKYMRSKEAASKRTGGLRFTKLVPPGA